MTKAVTNPKKRKRLKIVRFKEQNAIHSNSIQKTMTVSMESIAILIIFYQSISA